MQRISPDPALRRILLRFRPALLQQRLSHHDPLSVVSWLARAGLPLSPRRNRSRGLWFLSRGVADCPATGCPSSTKPMETQNSGIPSTNSRVPSRGPTTHTRRLLGRETSSTLSSDSHPSPSRSKLPAKPHPQSGLPPLPHGAQSCARPQSHRQ